MTAPSSPLDRYTRIAMLLHWLVAALIIGGFALGLAMVDLPISPQRIRWYNWHKWIGITILLLVFIRLFWRATHRPPAHLPMPAWQNNLAQTVHVLLYVLMLAVPVTGWLYSSAAGFTVYWFGQIPIPDLVGRNKELAEIFKETHGVLTKVLLVTFLLHLAGALKHHFIDKDGALRRMLP